MRSIGPDIRSRRALTRASLASAFAAVRARLRAERGSALIEVMVGAVLVAIASVAILNGLDGAQATGAKNKVRSVQATLAQQDIERMRSIPVTALSNLNQTRTVTVANVDYTVVSKTTWVSDRNGLVNCSDNAAQADYLKLSSTVTSPASDSRPVTQTGLLTPTVGQLSNSSGSATVKLTNRDGVPLAGVPVNISGPSSRNATTNALGCAVFGYVPSGSYAVVVTGLVEIDSNPATDTLVVYPGRASFGQLQGERPVSIRANFVPPSGNNTIANSAVTWHSITVKNSNLVGSKRTFTGARNTFVEGGGLFPYTDGVAVYAGSCAANDPSAGDPRTYPWGTNYFENDSPRGWTALAQNDLLRPVNVEMPTLRVSVTRQTVSGSVPAWFRTQLLITSKDNASDSACTLTAWQEQKPDRAATLNTQVVFDVAVPFGEYRICAATRGRTSGTSGGTTAAKALVNRRYTTSMTAGTTPPNPTDQNLKTPVPPTPNRTVPTISTLTASTTLCY